MRTKINVTQKHIDEGKKGECATCPVALAFKETMHTNVMVGISRTTYSKTSVKNSVGVIKYIRNYDTDKVTLPCTLILTDDTLSMEGETL